MNLHEFYISVQSKSEDELYSILCGIDSITEWMYPEFYRVESTNLDNDYTINLRNSLEDFELMNNIVNRELENR